MALLSFEQEYERAADERPFANGFEGESWMAHWCEMCVNSRLPDDCPLIGVALLGKTPQPWWLIDKRSLKARFACQEYQPDEPGTAGP